MNYRLSNFSYTYIHYQLIFTILNIIKRFVTILVTPNDANGESVFIILGFQLMKSIENV